VLWSAFWRRASLIPPQDLYRVQFSPAAPLQTPRGLAVHNAKLLESLGAAVLSLTQAGVPLGSAVGDYLRLNTAGGPIPLFGGCEAEGYFTFACHDAGNYDIDSVDFDGNNYLQLVRFGRDGPVALTLLANGEPEPAPPGTFDRSSGERYAAKRWLKFPFTRAEIERRTVGKTVLPAD
jgi:acyl-homoserine-lactone acylase